jgi:hypothetical protein
MTLSTYNRDYYLQHRIEYIAYQTSYRKTNPDRTAAAQKRYYQKNRDKLLEYQNKYTKLHPRNKMVQYKKKYKENEPDTKLKIIRNINRIISFNI